MEKRFYFGVGLLVLFLILGIVAAAATDSASAPIARQLEEAAREAVAGDVEKSIALAQSAKQNWQGVWKPFATVADHSPMDEIDGLFAELEIYAQAKDAVHLAACCAQLAELVEAMAEAHRPAWWNLV